MFTHASRKSATLTLSLFAICNLSLNAQASWFDTGADFKHSALTDTCTQTGMYCSSTWCSQSSCSTTSCTKKVKYAQAKVYTCKRSDGSTYTKTSTSCSSTCTYTWACSTCRSGDGSEFLDGLFDDIEIASPEEE